PTTDVPVSRGPSPVPPTPDRAPSTERMVAAPSHLVHQTPLPDLRPPIGSTSVFPGDARPAGVRRLDPLRVVVRAVIAEVWTHQTPRVRMGLAIGAGASAVVLIAAVAFGHRSGPKLAASLPTDGGALDASQAVASPATSVDDAEDATAPAVQAPSSN